MFCLFRSQAARGNEGKDGLSEMGTRLDPVPGLPGGEFKNKNKNKNEADMGHVQSLFAKSAM